MTSEKEPSHVRLSGELVIQLRVEGLAPLEVEIREDAKPSEYWSLQTKTPTTLEGAKGLALWQQEFLLRPEQPGDQELQLPVLRYREKDGDWQTVTWKPIALKITTQVAKADARVARDITSIEELPAVETLSTWPIWAAGAAILVAVSAAALLLVRRRRASRPLVTPEQVALAELEAIAAVTPVSSDDMERFHRMLSATLRRYLEQRLQLPVTRQTTAEFFASIREDASLQTAHGQRLRELLARCDLAKFAGIGATSECGQLLADARLVVSDTPATQALIAGTCE